MIIHWYLWVAKLLWVRGGVVLLMIVIWVGFWVWVVTVMLRLFRLVLV